MKESLIQLRNLIHRFLYKNIFKKIFFRIDPEKIHDRMTRTGQLLGYSPITRGITKFFFGYSNKKLGQKILGINFSNPIGLAAGFDKDANLTEILPSVGFGFAELGSITGEPCEGNPKPRLWRLKKSKGLVVYYGLKNEGCEKIAKKLKNKHFKIPIGISIAKTNSKKTVELEAGIRDYVKAYNTLVDIGDYLTINISCPNAFGGQPFSDPEDLDRLLGAIEKTSTKKPIFLKLPSDLGEKTLDKIIEVSNKHNINGFICTNLTKDRENKKIKEKIIEKIIPEKGGISGKVVEELANEVIRHIYNKTKDKYVIIGCGGVFSSEDAYKKIRLGASLIQMITGMIFEGPQVISEINQGLVKLLEKDGFKNISEAIGVDSK